MILKYTPERYEEFFLECVKHTSEEYGRRWAEHERAHFNKLIELGYLPTNYVIIFSNSSDPVAVGASIDFDESKVSLKDLAILALSPLDPSLTDLKTARRVFSKHERRQIWEAHRRNEQEARTC